MWDCGCAFCSNACVLVLGGGGALGESMDLLSSLLLVHASPIVESYFLPLLFSATVIIATRPLYSSTQLEISLPALLCFSSFPADYSGVNPGERLCAAVSSGSLSDPVSW